MDTEKRGLGLAILLLLVLSLFILCTDWLLYHTILKTQSPVLWAVIDALAKLYDNLTLVRSFYVVILVSFAAFYGFSTKKASRQKKTVLVCLCLILIGLFYLGYTSVYSYSLFVYPFIMLFMTLAIPATIKSFQLNPLKEDDSLFGLGNKKGDQFEVELGTSKGPLFIHNPRQGVQISGGAGSGKSASVIIPLIVQFIQKGYAGFLYDFEGNPTEKGSPILGSVAYTALQQLENVSPIKGKVPVQFAYINFNDMSKTHRVNPIHPKYITGYNFINELADMLMKNLNPEWRTKADFWAENAISFLSAIIYFQFKNHPDKCTLPHVVAIALSDWKLTLDMLVTDPDIAPRMQPLYTAYQEDAGNQTAGVVSSTQLPLGKLFNPEIFWVLSRDEISLDITSEAHPTVLCVGNDPATYQVLSAPISVISGVVMNQMNQMNKRQSFFMCDELPTLYINRLDHLPATGRKKGICTVLAFQDEAQLERDYGKENAAVIQGNLGNIFIGMTNNKNTAENFVKMLGETKREDFSVSNNSDTASQSTTHSLKREKVLETRDIMSQPIGQFTGKIAGSDKPFFRSQLDFFEFPPEEIPHFSYTIEEDTTDDNQEPELILYNTESLDAIDLSSEIDLKNTYKPSPRNKPPLLSDLSDKSISALTEILDQSPEDQSPDLQNIYDSFLKDIYNLELATMRHWLLLLEVKTNYETILEDVEYQLLQYKSEQL